MIELRDYQQKAIDDITEAASSGHRRILSQLPTGAGKAVIASVIAEHAVNNGKRVLFLAHRRELVWQFGEKIRSLGIEYGLLMSDEPHDPTLPMQVMSVQSFYTKIIRRKKASVPKADLVIVDEFHHGAAESWDKIMSLYPSAFILGFSATPVNKNGTGLGSCVDKLIQGPSIQELTDQGWLVPCRYFVPSVPDLQGLKVRAGDYVESEIETRMDKIQLVGDICENWSRICPDRKTIVFGCSVKHSIHIADQFKSIGIKAEHLDGKTRERERDRIVEEFKNGKVQVISNCALFNEGWDVPSASCLIFARPTKSIVLYLQTAGRVLRPDNGKKDTILIDHSGVIYEHGTLDQDFKWELDYDKKKTINKSMKKAKEKGLKRWITCEQCKCFYQGRLDCPECHWQPKIKGKPVATYEAYLQELTEDSKIKYVTVDKALWWRGFLWYAKEHNYTKTSRDGLPSWAYAKFREKFNSWPSFIYKRQPPLEPPLDVKSWINASRVKWAIINNKANKQKEMQNGNSSISSHGLERKDNMAGDAYQMERWEVPFA